MDPGMRLVTGWGATPTSPAPPDCWACAVRKVKGCASLLGVCGPPRPAEAGPELPESGAEYFAVKRNHYLIMDRKN